MKNLLSNERGEIVFLIAFFVMMAGGTLHTVSQKNKQIDELELEMAKQKHYLRYHEGAVDKENFIKDELRKARAYKIQ